MPVLDFPLRLSNGFLRRIEEPEAILASVRIMAMTPRGSWPGCPSFGIRDLLEASTRGGNVMDEAVQKANAGLLALGIESYWLENLERDEGSVREAGVFKAVLASNSGSRRCWTAKIELNRP